MHETDDATRAGKTDALPILVPVDFSEGARLALLWACDLAQRSGARVIVLHVVHDPTHATGYYQRDEKDLMKPMEEVAAKMMRQFMKETGKQAGEKKYYKRLETKLVVGLPVTRILEVCDKSGAGQIVMGSQGRTGLKRLMIGSKAEQVLRMAAVPVTIVKAAKKK
jgi:nucleotide-binding universal stress UspA family protein